MRTLVSELKTETYRKVSSTLTKLKYCCREMVLS